MEFNGYLPKQECQFMHQVKDELETFRKTSNRKRVLLFPPLPSRLRYLIHSHIEDLPELTTFSVGEGWCRRVVVCYSELRSEEDEAIDLEINNSLCEEPLKSRCRGEECNVKSKSSIASRSRGRKRPDQPLYMPRAARERLSLQNSQGPPGDQELRSPVSSSCISSSSDSCSCPANTENTKSSSSSTSTQDCLPSGTDRVLSSVADSPVLCPQGLTLLEAEPQVLDQSVASFSDMTLEDDDKDKDYLASLPCEDVTEEIKAHLKEALTVSIEHAHGDYSMYVNVCISINPDEFGHVIEIYDFPHMFKTDDLLDAFAEYSDGGMKIKWIDHTHALGVFSSESAAVHALSICHPMLKTRALVEGSKKAKAKAIRSAEFIQPVKERPRTDCAVAQRMVTRALGLKRRGRVQRY
uniref:R3H and coiled-coil domain-containing protein 1 n=1 Tax=Scatophagus argus TaxID=75038 RepID=UPI001ED81FE9|nr:R3H and coiled-coil domain-containing protein 1 [Scatophagus argus]XP_046240332.1 R3H and coiled-coil domain-containing protein 1 [Scatophagus argus]